MPTTDPAVEKPTPDAPIPPAPDANTSPSLIVTSTASRGQYGNDVSDMQAATSSLGNGAQQTYNFVDAGDKVQTTQAGSSEEALNKAPNIKSDSGVQLKPGDTQVAEAAAPAATNAYGSPKTGANADGSVTNPDGTITTKDGVTIDASLKSTYESSVKSLDSGIQQAKSAVQSAMATLRNDPAAAAAASQIMAKYDQQIELMKEKNKFLIAGYQTSAARNGSLQYANEMESQFLSGEQDKATRRITDLVAEETALVLKSNQAYKDGDVKALAAANKAYKEANKEKIDTIAKLLKATNDKTKLLQAQAKTDAASAKQKISDDIRISSALGKNIADAILKTGITDEKQINEYVKRIAQENGISNPEFLRSAYVKERDAGANQRSIIAKRSGTGSGGTKTTVPQATANLKAGLKPISQGGVLGIDGYMDPDTWVNQRDEWVSQKLPISTFNTLYKRYLNPESYGKAGFKTSEEPV